MRIWSLHPRYLDAKGLVALWRETLLAKNVLEGKTKGYRYHPQLWRFKESGNSLEAIHFYLQGVYEEAGIRNYKFDVSKFMKVANVPHIPVTQGQVDYEWQHLLTKLHHRDNEKYLEYNSIKKPELHPLFVVIEGGVASWEIT